MSIGFLRLSGSKRGSVYFGKVWRFPASHPTWSQHGEWSSLHVALQAARLVELEVLHGFLGAPCCAEPQSSTLLAWRPPSSRGEAAFVVGDKRALVVMQAH